MTADSAVFLSLGQRGLWPSSPRLFGRALAVVFRGLTTLLVQGSNKDPEPCYVNLHEEDKRLFDEEFIYKSIGEPDDLEDGLYNINYSIIQVKRYGTIY